MSQSAEIDGSGSLTIDQASDLVGDDIAYWLNNPFMDRESIAAKVCWWISRAAAKGGQSGA